MQRKLKRKYGGAKNRMSVEFITKTRLYKVLEKFESINDHSTLCLSIWLGQMAFSAMLTPYNYLISAKRCQHSDFLCRVFSFCRVLINRNCFGFTAPFYSFFETLNMIGQYRPIIWSVSKHVYNTLQPKTNLQLQNQCLNPTWIQILQFIRPCIREDAKSRINYSCHLREGNRNLGLVYEFVYIPVYKYHAVLAI